MSTTDIARLKTEYEAIKGRIEKAVNAVEETVLQTQFGERLRHLEERLAEHLEKNVDPPPSA